MTKEELMKFLLGKSTDNNRISCLVAALQAARFNTGRNIETGEGNIVEMKGDIFMKSLDYTISIDTIMMSGLINYLILLDLVGLLFKKKPSQKPTNITNGIKLALMNFSDTDEKIIEAIKQLRNSLTHCYSLATALKKRKKEKEKDNYKFILIFKNASSPITLPKDSWYGDCSDKSENTSTKVYVPNLCDLIEEIVKEICNLYEKDELEFRIDDLEEIKTRFTML